MSAEDTYEPLNGASSVPSLMNCCLRVISANINAIESLGDMPYALVKPILEDKRCTAEILRKIEINSPVSTETVTKLIKGLALPIQLINLSHLWISSPRYASWPSIFFIQHLRKDDQEIWRKHCFDEYSECREKHARGELDHVNSWRKFYMQCRLDREEKLNQATSRMREKRERDDAERKGRQLIVTDKLPPPKRAKWGGNCCLVDSPIRRTPNNERFSSPSIAWGGPTKPKTLLEKARTQTKKATSVYRGSSTSNSPSSLSTSASKAFSRPSLAKPPGSSTPISPKPLTQSANKVHHQLLKQYMESTSPIGASSNTVTKSPSKYTSELSSPSNNSSAARPSLMNSRQSDTSVLPRSSPTSVADFVIGRSSNR
ncbi:hypothetical protein FRC03_000007 [Tulasnella sp. 419]|nr:hypothetical protein FRC03_000007 [Tulasnella sp. 419]